MSKSSQSSSEDVGDRFCISAIALHKPSSEDSLFNNLEHISAQLDSLDLKNQQNIGDLEALVDNFIDFIYKLVKTLPQNVQDKFFDELSLDHQEVNADFQAHQYSNVPMDSIDLKLAKSQELATSLANYLKLGAAVLPTSDDESTPQSGQHYLNNEVNVDAAGACNSCYTENFDVPIL